MEWTDRVRSPHQREQAMSMEETWVPLTIWAGGGYVLPDWSAPND